VHLRRKMTVYAAAMALAVGAGALVLPSVALAHGTMMKPGSRTYLCWKDGLTSTGEIKPKNPACSAAVAQSGPNSLYNWFAVLRSDGAGRTSGFIPDGKLCSGAAVVYDFSGFDLPRSDWPVTHLTTGGTFNWEYSNWARHPGTFRMYVTKDSWSPTRSLAWSDMESTPFLSVTNPADVGGAGTADGHYYWSGNLPSAKSGRHIIYSVWARSDSQETFYSCSDVVFDGGNGEVTGVGDGSGNPGPTPTTPVPTSPTPTIPGDPAPSTPPPTGNAGCSASYATASSWSNGFQGTVTVRNTGSSTIGSWMVHWMFPGSQTITQIWNGTSTQTGSLVTATNVNWNGTIPPGGSTTFGFLGAGSAPVIPAAGLTCMIH
jgi:predicted carbohydrate-binding protein with CBM5 and CBM33 domain